MIYLTAGAVAIAIAVFGIWFANYRGRAAGRKEAEINSNAPKAAEVIAEHRSDDDTAKRLRDGTF